MRVVAIDTASRESAWVVACDGRGALSEQRELPGGSLDRRLSLVLGELLVGGADAVVVLTGPGSYNGVRAGMAAALGLSSALGIPLHGLGNLEATAGAAAVAPGEDVTAVADAGRGGVYVAWFRGGPEGPEPAGSVERLEDAAVPPGRLLATAPIRGLEVEVIDPAAALAAAVPLALARAPLAGAGLAATHAVARVAAPS